MISVSIIVPIYNTEKYLEKCIRSLVNQTLDNIEIILVNDASPDNSSKIMEEYAGNYKNIKNIFLKENLYQGGARNKGIEIAEGEYLMFVDSDDYIDLDYCEKMYLSAKEDESDMVYSAFKKVDENGNIIKEQNIYSRAFAGVITDNKRKGFLEKSAYSFGKLFKKEIWEENGLGFPIRMKFEDIATIPLFMMYAKKCSYVKDTAYYYVKREGSTVTSGDPKQYKDALAATLLFKERMEERGFASLFQEELEHLVTKKYYAAYLRRCLTLNDERLLPNVDKVRKNLYQMYPDFWNNKYMGVFPVVDIMRMKMNDLGAKAALTWQNHYRETMLEDTEFAGAVCENFYRRKIDKIEDLIKNKGLKSVLLLGTPYKKLALSRILRELDIEIIDEAEVNQDILIIAANPGSEWNAERKYPQNKILNMEDYLNEYFD